MDEAVRLFFELGSLKEFQRSGWVFIGEKDGDSIADHSWRAAIIAYYLAKKVGANPDRCALMAIVHDMPESRTGDINKVWNRYLKKDEEAAMDDILNGVPELEEFKALLEEYNSAKNEDASIEAKVVKDADLLDLIFQALFYYKRGNKRAMEWVINARRALLLDISKELTEKALVYEGPWWRGIKKFD